MNIMSTVMKERGSPVRKDSENDLFDNTTGYDDDTGIRFASGLTVEERVQATALYRLFNGLWGVCVVKGDPGTGKDLFGNYLTYKLKRFFPQKRTVRDEKPRELFGTYDGFFDDKAIVSSVRKMTAIAKGKKTDDEDRDVAEDHTASQAAMRRLEGAADDWVEGEGGILLNNAIVYLTEFWRYCYNREPHNPMNKTMGAIHKVKRHLNSLILGTTQQIEDLDRKTCKPWIDWQVTCTRSSINRTGFAYFVQRVKYDRRMDVLIPIGASFPIRIDAGKPRTNMGDGRIVIRKPQYRPETEEEKIVLDVLQYGHDDEFGDLTVYENLVGFIEAHGDMSEWEILETLKDLSFIPRKHVIDYPCYFRLYNSKSAPQLKTSLKVED